MKTQFEIKSIIRNVATEKVEEGVLGSISHALYHDIEDAITIGMWDSDIFWLPEVPNSDTVWGCVYEDMKYRSK